MAAPQTRDNYLVNNRPAIIYQNLDLSILRKIAIERNIRPTTLRIKTAGKQQIIELLNGDDIRDPTWVNRVMSLSATYDPTLIKLEPGPFAVLLQVTGRKPIPTGKSEQYLRVLIYKLIMNAPIEDINRYLTTLTQEQITNALTVICQNGFITNIGDNTIQTREPYTRIDNFEEVPRYIAEELISKRDFELLSIPAKREVFETMYRPLFDTARRIWSQHHLPEPVLTIDIVMGYLFDPSETNRRRIIENFGMRRVEDIDNVTRYYRMTEPEIKLVRETYMVASLIQLSEVFYRTVSPTPLLGKSFTELQAMSYRDLEIYFDKLMDVELENVLEIGSELMFDRLNTIRQAAMDVADNVPNFYHKYRGPRTRAINQHETISLTNLDDPNTYFVAYGTLNRYYIYELQDLIDAAYTDTETGVFRMRRPENPAESFLLSELAELSNLIFELLFDDNVQEQEEERDEADYHDEDEDEEDEDVQYVDRDQDLLTDSPEERAIKTANRNERSNRAINFVRNHYRERGGLLSQADRERAVRFANTFIRYTNVTEQPENDRDIIQEFSLVTQKSLVSEFLHQIFITGMYMRRWKGPGNPYPLRAGDTRCERDPEPIVRDNLSIAQAILDRMSDETRQFCMNLPIVQYLNRGRFDVETNPFSSEWNNVVTGQQCIRMASTKFVGTAVYYLNRLLNETIVGMENARVDRIY
jgi:hypothetical protein